MTHAHVVIFITLYDDFGLVMKDYLSQVLTMITTDHGGAAHLSALWAMDF